MTHRWGSLPLLCALIISLVLHWAFFLRLPNAAAPLAFDVGGKPMALTLGPPPKPLPERAAMRPKLEKVIKTAAPTQMKSPKKALPQEAPVAPALPAEQLENLVIKEAQFRSAPVAPRYPEKARQKRQEGLVLVRAQVDPLGQTQAVRIARSSGFPLLDKAAIDAVLQWDFMPAMHNEKKIMAWIEVPIDFKLR